jgi:hypothetical protein
MVHGFGPSLAPLGSSWSQVFLPIAYLNESDLPVEIGFFLRVELEGDAAN